VHHGCEAQRFADVPHTEVRNISCDVPGKITFMFTLSAFEPFPARTSTVKYSMKTAEHFERRHLTLPFPLLDTVEHQELEDNNTLLFLCFGSGLQHLRAREVCFQPAKMHRINRYHFHFNLLTPIYVAHAKRSVLMFKQLCRYIIPTRGQEARVLQLAGWPGAAGLLVAPSAPP
jgi:hypothetical protein